ncbi:MAG: adenylate/guanylate cyclase domain-containing protein [Magnetovibrionaceae bacterium]
MEIKIPGRTLVHLVTGLAVLSYVTCHLINIGFGIVSLEAMDRVRLLLVDPWSHPLPTTILALCALTHVGLALWKTFSRRSLDLSAWAWVQLVFGFSVPFLLAEHVASTALSAVVLNTDPTYKFVMAIDWFYEPHKGLLKASLLLFAWIHGIIGLHQWLKYKPWFPNAERPFAALALVIPLVAMLGYIAGGLEARELAQERAWVDAMLAELRYPGQPMIDLVTMAKYAVWGTFGTLLVLTFAARLVRLRVQAARAIQVSYPGGRCITLPPGGTILEASQLGNVPHAHVCGGKGRCSTCRIRVHHCTKPLPAPGEIERKILRALGAPEGLRLACQLRPEGDIEVTPLLAQDTSFRKGVKDGSLALGQEKRITIMFCDLRGFTTLSEDRLPFDVVYLLNRYFRVMGEAIEGAGGRIDKFIGDGIMALFGITSGPEQGSRQALAAARAMGLALEQLNKDLGNDLDRPLRFGIGLHHGAVIVGSMGHGETTSITAIGDVVNTASRLEAMTKEQGVELIVSDAVGHASGIDISDFPSDTVAVRGRAQPIKVRKIARAKALPEQAAGQ